MITICKHILPTLALILFSKKVNASLDLFFFLNQLKKFKCSFTLIIHASCALSGSSRMYCPWGSCLRISDFVLREYCPEQYLLTLCISVMSTYVSLTAKWFEIIQINTQVSIQLQTHILPMPKCSGLPFLVKKGRVPPIGTQLVTCPMHLLLLSTSTCLVPSQMCE